MEKNVSPITNKISENYHMQKVLGQGCYGQVIQCFKKDTRETVAVKVLKQVHATKSNIREIFILKMLSSLDPDKVNIVRCHESFTRFDRTFMVFEILDISLFDYICQTKCAPLPLDGIRTVIRDLATAFHSLKGIGLIHTDLKLDNIMMVDHKKHPFKVKLIDFGLTLMKSEVRPGLLIQPLRYRSPEVFLGLPFSEAIDMWSLGSVMAELLLGFSLFPGKHEYDVMRFITELLGDPDRKLLKHGKNTRNFYNGKAKFFLYLDWTFKTPEEYHRETRIRSVDTRRRCFSSLDDLKTYRSYQNGSTDTTERSACVDLLKEMFRLDSAVRITPSGILEHPFITRSFLSDTQDKYAAATKDGNGSAESKVTVIMVQPADESRRTELEESDIGQYKDLVCVTEPHADQPDMAVSLQVEGLEVETDSNSDTSESESESDLESLTSNEPDQTGLVPESRGKVQPPPKGTHAQEEGEPEEKKKKKKNRVRRFFSSLKRAIFGCFGGQGNRTSVSGLSVLGEGSLLCFIINPFLWELFLS